MVVVAYYFVFTKLRKSDEQKKVIKNHFMKSVLRFY